MKSRALLDELQKLSHVFSREAAARKLELLEALETQRLSSARSLEKLQSLLCFIRAYPDSRAVLARAAALAEALRGDVEQFIEQFIEQGGDEPLQNTGLPGAAQHHAYSYQVLQDLIRIAPGCLEVDWDEFEREGALLDALVFTVSLSEVQGLEALYFFLIMKNGIPIAYGPASVLLGCCEMGINLFPEFRGGEIRTICSHLMRTLYHAAHVRYFFLTSYAMGEGNDDALRSGAFWFYRKLGFLPTNPAVEELARQEEARMRQEPDVRSGLAMLRRLTHTSAYLDMSGGQCCPIELGRLGIQVSRHVARKHGGDRKQALTASVRQVRRALGIGSLEGWSRDSRQALESLSPILTQIEDLGQWSKRDRQALAAIIQAKAAPTETAYLERSFRHPRLASALNQIAHAD